MKNKQQKNPSWPFECYGNTRPKRKCPDGYRTLFSSNFSFRSIFKMLKKINAYKKSGKGYVVFDKAFDISNTWLPSCISITVFIKKECIETYADEKNELMWWMGPATAY